MIRNNFYLIILKKDYTRDLIRYIFILVRELNHPDKYITQCQEKLSREILTNPFIQFILGGCTGWFQRDSLRSLFFIPGSFSLDVR